MIRINIESAVSTLRSEFKDLSGPKFDLAVARAINHTLGKLKTTSSREIRTIYAVSAKEINSGFSIRKATRGQLFGFLGAKGKPLPLAAFKPRQTKEGVSIVIKKGKRVVIKGAFMSTMGSGYKGVFARGTYQGGDFEFRRKRTNPAGGARLVNGRWRPVNNDLQVNEVHTLTLPKAFENAVVIQSITRQVDAEFPARMMHELLRM